MVRPSPTALASEPHLAAPRGTIRRRPPGFGIALANSESARSRQQHGGQPAGRRGILLRTLISRSSRLKNEACDSNSLLFVPEPAIAHSLKSEMPAIQCTGLCETPLGLLVHRWTSAGLYQVELCADPASPKIKAALEGPDSAATPEIEAFTNRIEQYFAGQLTTFDEIPIDESDWPPFFGQVYRACRQVESGQTISYQELARRAGRPAAARAVGQAMARNRIPIVIPCHRIVGSSGRMTGFSADGGIETKRWLLDRERSDSLFDIDR